MFPKLRALDGYRKVSECINLKDALPAEASENFSYEVDNIEWFDMKAIENPNPAKGLFEDTIDVRREESQLTAILNDCKQSL